MYIIYYMLITLISYSILLIIEVERNKKCADTIPDFYLGLVALKAAIKKVLIVRVVKSGTSLIMARMFF